MRRRSESLESLAVLHPNAAGLDIGAREIWASVPPGRANEPVQRFGTFTPDLQNLVDWLVQNGVDTVALERRARGCIGYQYLRCWKHAG